jgi:hypothetical protein
VLLSVDLLESLLILPAGASSTPLGAPIPLSDQWAFSGILALAFVAVLGGAFLLRSTTLPYYLVIGLGGFGGVLIGAFLLLWMGRLLTLLAGLVVFVRLLSRSSEARALMASERAEAVLQASEVTESGPCDGSSGGRSARR